MSSTNPTPLGTITAPRRYVLASGSPRRRQLLARLGIPFEVDVAEIDETPKPRERAAQLALRLACEKAAAVIARHPAATVIAADTVVSHGPHLYGKPRDADDAMRILQELTRIGHVVTTGVAIGEASFAVSTRVWLKRWSDAEIAAYVASGDPLDKAGAYGVQNAAFEPVARLSGCSCNVVGLPIGGVAARLGLDGAAACAYGRYEAGRCGSS